MNTENATLLPFTEVSTGKDPVFTVIWLHGLGADGSDFVSIVPELGLDNGPAVRFIFPDAPAIPVTCNGGHVMPAWYDIISLNATSRVVSEQGILSARASIRDLITRENQRGIPCSNIVLAGFSQGGAVAYTTALTHPEALAGLITLSAYLPSEALIARDATEANRAMPIFAGHGTDDNTVSIALGSRARDTVTRHGCRLEWHEYAIGHSVCIEEIHDVGCWLQLQLQGTFGQKIAQVLENIDLTTDTLAAYYIKTERVEVAFAKQAGELISLEGPNRFEIGDALITGTTGSRWSVSIERFNNKYEAVAPTRFGDDGCYIARPVPVLAKQIAVPFTAFRSNGGDRLRGNAGDWLLQYGPGDFGVADSQRFTAVYQRLENPRR